MFLSLKTEQGQYLYLHTKGGGGQPRWGGGGREACPGASARGAGEGGGGAAPRVQVSLAGGGAQVSRIPALSDGRAIGARGPRTVPWQTVRSPSAREDAGRQRRGGHGG